MSRSNEIAGSARVMFGGFSLPGRPNFGPVFAPDDGGGNTGDNQTQQQTQQTQTTQQQTAQPWYSTVSDEGLRGTLSKFESQDKLFEAIGYKPPTGADWRAAITDADLAEHAKRFNSPADLVRANLDQRKQLSSAIVRPPKDAKPEQIAAWRKAMDIPEKPEDYGLTRPEHIDEEKWNSEAVKGTIGAFTKMAHEAGAPKALTQAIAQWYFGAEQAAMKAEIEADKAFLAEAEAALKQEWGGEFAQNKEYGSRGLAKVAAAVGVDIEDLRRIEMKSGRFLLDDPRVMKIFAAVGREMGEHDIGEVMTNGQRDSVNSEISALNDKISAALAQGNHAEAQRLDTQMTALITKRDGNKNIVGVNRAA
jgi:hypothetical protein